MKLVAVAFLVTAMVCNSTLAMAEGPVPFKELMQAPGAQPSGPIPDAKNQAEIASQLAKTGHMTTKGKVMTGVGIGMVLIGGGLVGAALWRGSTTPPDKAKLYSAGGGVMVGGTILIVLGAHQRSWQ